MEPKKKFRKGDYLLLLLYADNQSRLQGRTRLQKIAFLFEKEIMKPYGFDKQFNLQMELDFEPYHYGPFSKKVFQFIDLFETLGLVKSVYEPNPDNQLDADIFIDDLLQVEDSEWVEEIDEVKMDNIPVYCLTSNGQQYVEKNLWRYLNLSQRQALDKLKKDLINIPLKLLLKYIYGTYPDSAIESKIKEEILKETRWKF